LYFKYIYPDSIVDIFEPDPANINILKENIQKNNITGVTLHNKAIGDKDGRLRMEQNGIASTLSKDFSSKQIKNGENNPAYVQVEVKRLSEYINSTIDFLKLDIEGTEGDVLKELDQSGKIKNIKLIAMEYHSFSKENNLLSDISRIFERNDFEVLCSADYKNFADIPNREYKKFMIFARNLETKE
jgi:FkbM family methyltransferase